MAPVTTVGLVMPASVGIPSHSSFVRKCALQSTSMPALHRRNVPNCRLMADGGMRKCSAGACPPLGLGVGRGRIHRADSLYQTTTPAFHTLVRRHERFVRK